jgi:hypothetical protein
VSTAAPVPETHKLEGDDAFEVLRQTGLRELARDSFMRFRAADGVSPRRRQPDVSWLAFGSGLAVVLWLGFTGALALYLAESREFGETYGPLAGTIGILLWTLFTSLAFFLGLAFAAQLEAIRAGTPGPRLRS